MIYNSISSIKKYLEKTIGENITNLHYLGHGACNYLYFFEIENKGSFILKQERGDKLDIELNDLLSEAKILKNLHSLNPKIFPTVLFISENPTRYSYQFIDGILIDQIVNENSDEENGELFFELGKYIFNLHQIYKKINTRDVVFDNLNMQSRIKNILGGLKQSDCLTTEIKSNLTKILESQDFTSLLLDTQPIHGDVHKGNLLVKDGKISGIVDYGDFRISNIHNEFVHLTKQYPQYIERVLNGYSCMSSKKIDSNLVKTLSLITDIEKTLLYHQKRYDLNSARIFNKLKESI